MGEASSLAHWYYSSTAFTALVKLHEFSSLPQGWHYGRGGPITFDIIDRARAVVRRLIAVGLTFVDVFAGADGEVLVSAYHNTPNKRHHVATIIEPDGSYSVSHEIDGRDLTCEESLSEHKALDAIRRAAESIWNTTGSYTRAISTIDSSGSTTWRSRRAQTGAVRPYFYAHASTNGQGGYALMHG